jgi:GTP cyclohydrolase I
MDSEASKRSLTWSAVRRLLVDKIPLQPCYGVPRGGCFVAAMTGRAVDSPEEASIIVDDIVDSGRTRTHWQTVWPDKPFHALIDKTDSGDLFCRDGWINFPWDATPTSDVEENIVRILEFIGEDPKREGLQDTPQRVVRSWKELFGGYGQDAAAVLVRDFEAENYDEMILCRNIDFYSTCEHHMQPFFGTAHVGYVPKRRIIGLSKLARLVEMFARRLQIQERLTQQIANALEEHLQPRGVAVLIEAKHFCMMCRGVRKQNSEMTTSSLTGVFRSAEPRAEFLALVAR